MSNEFLSIEEAAILLKVSGGDSILHRMGKNIKRNHSVQKKRLRLLKLHTEDAYTR